MPETRNQNHYHKKLKRTGSSTNKRSYYLYETDPIFFSLFDLKQRLAWIKMCRLSVFILLVLFQLKLSSTFISDEVKEFHFVKVSDGFDEYNFE